MQDFSSQFLVRKDITYLNYGSFGACAKPVFERYQQYQLELEQEAVQFITVNGPQYLEQSERRWVIILTAVRMMWCLYQTLLML